MLKSSSNYVLLGLVFFFSMLALMSGPAESGGARSGVKGETFGREKKGFGTNLRFFYIDII